MSSVPDHLSTFRSEALPSGWRTVTLEDIVDDDGVFVDGDWVESKDQDPGGDVRLIQLADVGEGEFRDRSERFLTSAKASKLGCTFLEPGDLLIARMPDPLGRACIFPGDKRRAVTVVDVAVVRPSNSELNTRWLMYCINAPQFRRVVASLQSGSTRQRISRKNLAKIVFPLPPRDWQDETVAEIEKYFSRLDEAVANLKRVKANLKRYKAAVLKAAVEGRLVPTEAELAYREGRKYEPGAQLLEQLLEARRTRWAGRGRYKEPVGPILSEDFAVPNGWTIASLDQLTSKITSGSRDWSPYYDRGSSVFVLAQNVRPMVPDFSVRQLVDPPKADPSRERSRVNAGDLLATIVGANTGQVCIVNSPPEDAYVCQSVALIRPLDFSISSYLNCWLNSEEHGQRYFERCMYGQGRPHLSFEQLMATPIALPPVADQRRIVAEVDRRLSFSTQAEAQTDADIKRAEHLRESILAWAVAPLEGTTRRPLERRSVRDD